MFEGEDRSIDAILPAAEGAELLKIKREAGVVGFVLVDSHGKQLASDGVTAELLGPVFANAFDICDSIAMELGETRNCPAMFFGSAEYEVAGIRLSTCNALIVREKPKAKSRGFSNGN